MVQIFNESKVEFVVVAKENNRYLATRRRMASGLRECWLFSSQALIVIVVCCWCRRLLYKLVWNTTKYKLRLWCLSNINNHICF